LKLEEINMKSFSKYLSEVKLGEMKVCDNLTMFGLEGPAEQTLDYLTLHEAMTRGFARVSEISDNGSVPELLFENSADLPVLILDGEELLGAKQNRTVNVTVLAPARETVKIPVSCVEAGRWRHETAHFAMSDRHHFAQGRAVKAATVSRSLEVDGSHRADQQRVWADISAKAARLGAPSPTQAMGEIFDRHQRSLDGFVAALTHSEFQTGALFAIGSEVMGLDLFDRHATCAMVLPKLVRSYAIDAMETRGGNRAPAKRKEARAFLEDVAAAKIRRFGAVGLGSDLRLDGAGLVGGGLAVDGKLIHLAVFAMRPETPSCGVGFEGMASIRSRRGSFRGQ
jgi:hypothetical protein